MYELEQAGSVPPGIFCAYDRASRSLFYGSAAHSRGFAVVHAVALRAPLFTVKKKFTFFDINDLKS
jgi:hypothetical protein